MHEIEPIKGDEQMRLCKDCAHFQQYSYPVPAAAACAAPQRNVEPDPVHGRRHTLDARMMRRLDGPHTCGPEARWFDPKPAPPPSLRQRIAKWWSNRGRS